MRPLPSIAAALVSALAAIATVPTLGAQGRDSAPRDATVPARGVEVVRVVARAGSLRITGSAGLTEVRVRGTAYASRQRDLDDIRLRAERRGDAVEVEAVMPEHIGIGHWDDRLDLSIEVPGGVRLEVEDGSGDVEIRGTAALELVDGSGHVEVQDIGGGVEIKDGSGDLRLRGIRGDVRVSDGSGSIWARDVDGGMTVDEDGSGAIEAEHVGGTVHVRRDGSGGIEVSDVSGDFIVDRDGSGGVKSRNVKGQIRLPRS